MVPTVAIHPVFFAAGYLFGLVSESLAVAAFAGIFIRPKPVGYVRFLDILAFVLVAVSALIGFAYIWEMFTALHSDNPYEQYAFLHGRFAGPITDFIHFIHPAFPVVPWAPYWWVYHLQLAAIFSPQLFWIPAFRRQSILTFGVACIVTLYIWWDRLMMLLVQSFHGM